MREPVTWQSVRTTLRGLGFKEGVQDTNRMTPTNSESGRGLKDAGFVLDRGHSCV